MPTGKTTSRVHGRAIGLAAFAILAIAAALLLIVPQPAPAPDIGGPYTLTTNAGHIMTQRADGARYRLIYFGYTRCKDVCPATLTTLATALDRLGDAGHAIEPVFITLDPRHDTPDVLTHFVHAFGPRLIGAAGNAAETSHLISTFRITVFTAADGGDLDHSSLLYLMNADGTLNRLIPADSTADNMIALLTRALNEDHAA